MGNHGFHHHVLVNAATYLNDFRSTVAAFARTWKHFSNCDFLKFRQLLSLCGREPNSHIGKPTCQQIQIQRISEKPGRIISNSTALANWKGESKSLSPNWSDAGSVPGSVTSTVYKMKSRSVESVDTPASPVFSLTSERRIACGAGTEVGLYFSAPAICAASSVKIPTSATM